METVELEQLKVVQRVRCASSGVSVGYLYDLAGHAITELGSFDPTAIPSPRSSVLLPSSSAQFHRFPLNRHSVAPFPARRHLLWHAGLHQRNCGCSSK